MAYIRGFANGTNGMPMTFEVSPLAAIGYHSYLKYANGYQWLPMVFTNLADNLEGRQNYQRAKLRHPQLNEFHIYCNLLIFTGSTSKNYSEDYVYCKAIVDRNSWINLFL